MPPILDASGTTNDTKGLPEGVPKFTRKARPQKVQKRIEMEVFVPTTYFKKPLKIQPWAKMVPAAGPRGGGRLQKPPKSCHQASTTVAKLYLLPAMIMIPPTGYTLTADGHRHCVLLRLRA